MHSIVFLCKQNYFALKLFPDSSNTHVREHFNCKNLLTYLFLEVFFSLFFLFWFLMCFSFGANTVVICSAILMADIFRCRLFFSISSSFLLNNRTVVSKFSFTLFLFLSRFYFCFLIVYISHIKTLRRSHTCSRIDQQIEKIILCMYNIPIKIVFSFF